MYLPGIFNFYNIYEGSISIYTYLQHNRHHAVESENCRDAASDNCSPTPPLRKDREAHKSIHRFRRTIFQSRTERAKTELDHYTSPSPPEQTETLLAPPLPLRAAILQTPPKPLQRRSTFNFLVTCWQ